MDDNLMYRDEFYIGGKWTPGAGQETFDIVSPASEEVVGRIPVAVEEDIDRAVAAAREAFEGPWSTVTGAERADFLAAAAAEFRRRQPDLVAAQVAEMGIPVAASTGQCSALPPVLEYYAELARTYPFEREEVVGAAAGTVVSDPVGVVGAITPWNGPTVLSVWKIAPALAAGCTVVLKPPPESPLSQLVLAEVFDAIGLPPGVLNVVPGGREVGEHLVQHRGTDKIAFTGSTAAGKRIMAACSDQVKRVSLELGGKSAMILLRRHRLRRHRARLYPGGDAQLGPGVRHAEPGACPSLAVRRGGGTRRCGGGATARRRPVRPGYRDRPAGRPAPAGPGARLHPDRPRRGRPGGRRRAASAAPAEGLVRGADRAG